MIAGDGTHTLTMQVRDEDEIVIDNRTVEHRSWGEHWFYWGGKCIKDGMSWSATGGTPYGLDYEGFNSNGGAKIALFATVPQKSGIYEISTRYPSSSNRCANVPLTIVHDGENTSLTLDQRTGGKGWESLGNYYLPKGKFSCVMFGNNVPAGQHVVFDAVR